MKIIINESQLDVISKHINEAALPSFSLKELSTIKTFKDKVRYCVANLGKPISKEELWNYCDNNKFISELNDYIGSYDIGVGDLYCLSTYGLAMRNGQPSIVILDSGLSEYIYDTYYNM